ncbi:MAG: ThiF family adenylyltransferase [Pyrinomonadaceae bacterium]
MKKIDLSFAQAAVVMPKEHNKLRIIQVGAGGTGSFAALAIARLLYELKESGKAVEFLIADPDVVESANIPRSNFCAAEIGCHKAQSLAKRITLAWGLECGYSNETFNAEEHLKQNTSDYRSLTVIVGCVDNHLARRDIRLAVEKHQGYRPDDAANIWWIDAGNGKFSGQVLIGSNTKQIKPSKLFVGSSICKSLPAPSLVHPDLLDPETPSLKTEITSCPERIRLGEQSLNVNQRVAIEIGEMLSAMFLTRNLRRFATYFDLESGTSRSLYCTPDQIRAAIQKKK